MMTTNNPQIAANFERLKFEQERFLKISDDKISQWTKFKDDYIALRTRLETLPNELRYNIMVPISKVAFMPGRLVNTNEILVLLGDNWFVEKSAKQSCELIDRRLKSIETFLDELVKENKIFKEQLDWTQSLMEEKNEYVNIEEKIESEAGSELVVLPQKRGKQLSEEEKRELRRKQQEKARQHQTKIEEYIKEGSKLTAPETIEETKETEDNESQVQSQSESNDLAIESKILKEGEEMNEEDFDKLIQDYNKTIDRENNLMMEKKLKSVTEKKQEQQRRVKWLDKSENVRIVEDEDDEDDYYSDSQEDDYDSDDQEEEVKVSQQPIIIKIKHTKSEKLTEIERNLSLSRDKPDINSPGDIYTHFFKPKSILKNTNGENRTEIDKSSKTSEEPIENKAKPANFDPHKAFSGTIVERKVEKENVSTLQDDNVNQTNPKKTVSRFKASKMNQ